MKKWLALFLLFFFLALPAQAAGGGKNFAGFTVDPLNPGGAPDPAQLAKMKVGLVRVVYKENAQVENYVDKLINNGITPVLILNWEANSDAYYSGGGINSYIPTFENRVIKPAAQHYGNKVVYQIWNEPDGIQGTIPLSPENYAALLSDAYRLIKNQTGARVITAGLVSGNINYVARLLAASGGQLPADGIAYHPYIINLGDVVNTIKAFAQATGRPVWITEFGWETPNQDQQAAWLRSVMSLMQRSDLKQYLQATMWYAWSDAMNPGFGLVDANGNPKKAFRVFLEMLLGKELAKEFLKNFKPSMLVTPAPPVPGQLEAVGVAEGKPFLVTRRVCFNKTGAAIRGVIHALANKLAINDKQNVAETLEGTNAKLIPAGMTNKSQAQESRGEIHFKVCELNTHNWFDTTEAIVITVPKTYRQAATSGRQLAGFLNAPNSSTLSLLTKTEKGQAERAADEPLPEEANQPPGAATPPLCQLKNDRGELMKNVDTPALGASHLHLGENILSDILGLIPGVCRKVDFVFTPIANTPFTMPDEFIQRKGIFGLLAPPGPKAQENLQFRHGAAVNQLGVDFGGEVPVETKLDFFGQKGVDNAYRFTLEELTPPGHL